MSIPNELAANFSNNISFVFEYFMTKNKSWSRNIIHTVTDQTICAVEHDGLGVK